MMESVCLGDYSGSQTTKAARGSGVFFIVINSNIATAQTSLRHADRVYFLPVTVEFVTQVIKRERSDGILCSCGGQAALNCGVRLEEVGVLSKCDVKVPGAPMQAVIATEGRELFAKAVDHCGYKLAGSACCTTAGEAAEAAANIGYPVLVRAASALEDLGSGFAADEGELRRLVQVALVNNPQVIVDKSLKGWEELEYEAVRDANDNCIAVCNLENFDRVGIHTSDSIVIAPSQTLTNAEYFRLRECALKVVRHLGVVGECNIRYAMDPRSHEFRVIEVNARVFRSSALALKAIGYPLACVAAKLALGGDLVYLRNSVTRCTAACFEPSFVYVVAKVPRWDLRKFPTVDLEGGSCMESVEEVMSIGRTLEEIIHKALRMVDEACKGLDSERFDLELAHRGEEGIAYSVMAELRRPTPTQAWTIAKAFELGLDVEKIYGLTRIDSWFLAKLLHVHTVKHALQSVDFSGLAANPQLLREAERRGFVDRQIAPLLRFQEGVGAYDKRECNGGPVHDRHVRALRKSAGVVPAATQTDFLAAEFPAHTDYLYLAYNGTESDVDMAGLCPRKDAESEHADVPIMVIGCGSYRIGSNVELDWCSVNCVKTLRGLGKLPRGGHELDAVDKDGVMLNYAIAEHVENVGVRSGDASLLLLLAQKFLVETQRRVKQIGQKLSRELKIEDRVQAEAVTEAKADAEFKAAEAAGAQTALEADAESEVEAEADAGAEFKAAIEAEAQASVKKAAEAAARAQAEADADAAVGAAAEAEATVDAEFEAAAAAEAQVALEAEATAEAEADAAVNAEAEPKGDEGLMAAAAAEVQPEAEEDAKTDAEVKAAAEAEPETLQFEELVEDRPEALGIPGRAVQGDLEKAPFRFPGQLNANTVRPCINATSQVMPTASDYAYEPELVGGVVKHVLIGVLPDMERTLQNFPNVTALGGSYLGAASLEVGGLQEMAHSVVTQASPITAKRVRYTFRLNGMQRCARSPCNLGDPEEAPEAFSGMRGAAGRTATMPSVVSRPLRAATATVRIAEEHRRGHGLVTALRLKAKVMGYGSRKLRQRAPEYHALADEDNNGNSCGDACVYTMALGENFQATSGYVHCIDAQGQGSLYRRNFSKSTPVFTRRAVSLIKSESRGSMASVMSTVNLGPHRNPRGQEKLRFNATSPATATPKQVMSNASDYDPVPETIGKVVGSAFTWVPLDMERMLQASPSSATSVAPLLNTKRLEVETLVEVPLPAVQEVVQVLTGMHHPRRHHAGVEQIVVIHASRESAMIVHDQRRPQKGRIQKCGVEQVAVVAAPVSQGEMIQVPPVTQPTKERPVHVDVIQGVLVEQRLEEAAPAPRASSPGDGRDKLGSEAFGTVMAHLAAPRGPVGAFSERRMAAGKTVERFNALDGMQRGARPPFMDYGSRGAATAGMEPYALVDEERNGNLYDNMRAHTTALEENSQARSQCEYHMGAGGRLYKGRLRAMPRCAVAAAGHIRRAVRV
ncbi:unnamed protein product [Prorocentrum cordatum]|uniref:carbamoyl-phosphate synthase (ammonia) n=1 Tax=Prorocentrum cordatum TaxID=2364126 RepID=A0ABN9SIN4_9DINO|nr:unnamed protein product [Polarella glacialis]